MFFFLIVLIFRNVAGLTAGVVNTSFTKENMLIYWLVFHCQIT